MTETKKRKTALGVGTNGKVDGVEQVVLDQADTLEKLFGGRSPEMNKGLFRHCFKVVASHETAEDDPGNDDRFFMVAAVSEIAPRDGVERMLAVQMATTHVALMRVAKWLSNTDQLEQAKAHTNSLTKLTRAYTGQMEALRKHRNKGNQTVTVQHVNVESGGQAIVGNVKAGEGNA